MALLEQQKFWSSRVLNSIRDYQVHAFVYVPDYSQELTSQDYQRFELI